MAARNALLTLLAVLLAGPLTVWWVRPPAPRGLRTDPARFSAERALRHLAWIAAEPRPAGGERNALVRARLAEELEALGLEVERQRVELAVPGAAEGEAAPALENVVARRRGEASTGAVLVCAHHDSVAAGPGAADDGAAVAAVLETLRALGAEPARNDLVVLLSDGEELGLLGAQAFAAGHRWMDDVRVVLDFEARGAGGPSILFQTGPESGWLVERYARVAPTPFGTSLATAVYERMPNDTDFSVFRRRGIAGLDFAFLGGGAAYHRAADRPEVLSPASLQHHGETMLALLEDLGQRDLERERGVAELEYFPVPGGLVRYPRRWTLLAVGLAAVAAAAVAALGVRSGTFTPLIGALAAALVAGLGGAAAAGLGLGAQVAVDALVLPASAAPSAPGANTSSGELGAVAAWWGVLGLALSALWAVPERRRRALYDVLSRGSLLVAALFAVASAVAVPGAGHLGLAALVAAVGGHLVASRERSSGFALALFAWLACALVLLPLVVLLAQVGSVAPRAELVLGAGAAALALVPTLPLLAFVARELRAARVPAGLAVLGLSALAYAGRALLFAAGG